MTEALEMIDIPLTDKQKSEFLAKSDKFGHSAELLSAGKEELSFLTIPDLGTAAEYFCNATQDQKEERLKTFFNPVITSRSRLGQGMHDRCEASVYAGAKLLPDDIRGMASHLPLHAKAVSILKKVIKAGETWDVSVTPEEWGLNFMEELYVGLNIGTLILEPGAKLIIRGNVFSVLCQKIVCLPGHLSETDYHIGILPTSFPVDFKSGPVNGRDGKNGRNGEAGKDGIPVRVEKMMMGYRLLEHIDQVNLNGTAGTDGGNGENGARGRNGGMCKIAELVFRQVDGLLSVFSQAGTGGDGGNGGNGGDGGTGGNGAEGYRLVQGLLRGGNGGLGGNGGAGGNGGNSGNGGLSSNIYINVPEADKLKIVRRSLDSIPGNPGTGGAGGSAGKGGSGGSCGSQQLMGITGSDGFSGLTGKPGIAGRSRPGAVIFLNEKI